MSDSSADAADEWRQIASVLEGRLTSPGDVNDALTSLRGLRADLDHAEHRLIALARSSGSSWQEIAASLGVRSRQAAEQRFLRLGANAEANLRADLAAVRRRHAQRLELDARAGANAVRLRAAVAVLIDELERGLHRADGGSPSRERASRHADGGLRRPEHVSRHAGGRDATVLLALSTLRIAVDSEAGPLCDLAALAVSDLDALPRELRPSGLDAALGAVRTALRSIPVAQPAPHS